MNNLNQTASADRIHIGFFGLRNAGKSSLVNAVTGQSLSVVSDVAGTTTDPVKKAMELLPLGPVVIIDTPGLDDEGELGALRVQKARRVLAQTDLAVLVDKDRVKSGLYAIEEFQTDTLILDDGFQYLNLKSHINILLVDSTMPFDNHHVLPRGLMREPVTNITRADYIFLTKSDGSPKLRHLKTFIRRHNRRAEIIECCHRPKYLEDVFQRGQQFPLTWLKGKRTASLSAIANPASFNSFLLQNGAELVLKRHFADHHRYRQQEMIDFINDAKAAGAEVIMTTEKDAVRMPRLDRLDIPILFLRIEIDILSGQENFDQCISRICFL